MGRIVPVDPDDVIAELEKEIERLQVDNRKLRRFVALAVESTNRLCDEGESVFAETAQPQGDATP